MCENDSPEKVFQHPKLPEEYIFLAYPFCIIYVIINNTEVHKFQYLDENNRSFFPSSIAGIKITSSSVNLSYYNFPTSNIYNQISIRDVQDELASIKLEVSEGSNNRANWILSFDKTCDGYEVYIPDVIYKYCQCLNSYYKSLRASLFRSR